MQSVKIWGFSKLSQQELPSTEDEIESLKGAKWRQSSWARSAFWQSNWGTVKDDVIGVFKEFHHSGKFVRCLNSTFLVMIIKKGGAKDFKDYRPISLVSNLYKLLQKSLQTD